MDIHVCAQPPALRPDRPALLIHRETAFPVTSAIASAIKAVGRPSGLSLELHTWGCGGQSLQDLHRWLKHGIVSECDLTCNPGTLANPDVRRLQDRHGLRVHERMSHAKLAFLRWGDNEAAIVPSMNLKDKGHPVIETTLWLPNTDTADVTLVRDSGKGQFLRHAYEAGIRDCYLSLYDSSQSELERFHRAIGVKAMAVSSRAVHLRRNHRIAWTGLEGVPCRIGPARAKFATDGEALSLLSSSNLAGGTKIEHYALVRDPAVAEALAALVNAQIEHPGDLFRRQEVDAMLRKFALQVGTRS